MPAVEAPMMGDEEMLPGRAVATATTDDDVTATSASITASATAATDDDGTSRRNTSADDDGAATTLDAIALKGVDFVALSFPVAFMTHKVNLFMFVGYLVGSFETGDEEHNHLGTHTDEKHEVGTRDVGEFEEGAENHDGSTPAISIVHEHLSILAIHPFLNLQEILHFYLGHIRSCLVMSVG